MSMRPSVCFVSLSLLIGPTGAFAQCITDVEPNSLGPFTDGSLITFAEPGPPVGAPPAVLGDAHFVLTGFRFNGIEPMAGFPDGTGKEQIYQVCGPLLPSNASNAYDVYIPLQAPSGSYSLGLAQGPCPPVQTELTCENLDFLVTPSYIVTTVDRLYLGGNGEDDDDRPAELQFQFAGVSGVPITPDNPSSAPVRLTGNYPGGVYGSGHLTNSDGSTAEPRIPVLVGRETRMFFNDCAEESRSYPGSLEPAILGGCQNSEAQGWYGDRFEVALSGAEQDADSSEVWGFLAGAGAVGLSCYLTPSTCVTSGTLQLGVAVGTYVDEKLTDTDNYMGYAQRVHKLDPDNFSWVNLGGTDGLDQAFEDKDSDVGLITATFQNRRTGGLRIASYKVTLDRLDVEEGYEVFGGCPEPNEIFLNVRAVAILDGAIGIGPTHHLPVDSGGAETVFSIVTGGGVGLESPIAEEQFELRSSPESPALYVEIGVWENDGEGEEDLMGIHSETIYFQDLFSGAIANTTLVDSTINNLFVRHATMNSRDNVVAGFQGSDDHCKLPTDLPNTTERQGRVSISYTVEATWLKRVIKPESL